MASRNCLLFVLFHIQSLLTFNAGFHTINAYHSIHERFYLLRESLDNEGQYELMFLHESGKIQCTVTWQRLSTIDIFAASHLENMDFIANCSISASQLSLS